MKKSHIKKPEEQEKIALRRVNSLFREAKSAFREEKYLADRYVELARKIAMKYKVKIPYLLKRRFCRHCHKYLVPGINLRVRMHRGHIVYYCLGCRGFMRVRYKQ